MSHPLRVRLGLVGLAAVWLTAVAGAAEPTLTKFDLKSKSILPCARWADDKGTEVYLLDADEGLLLKVAVATGKVTGKKDFEKKVGWLDASAEGLIVSVPGKDELWVLDDKLEVKKTISIPGLRQAASSPKLSFAVVGGGDRSELRTVDLKKGTINKVTTTEKKFGRSLGNDPVVTPDGKWAFTTDTQGMIRFEIKGNELTPIDVARTGSNPRRVCVSPDSKWVCRAAGGGNPDLGGPYRTAIYPIDTFTKKECVLELGAYPTNVGFDPVGKKIYTANFKTQLIVTNMGGVKKAEYKIGKEEPSQFLPHPDGNKVLLIGKGEVTFVELPKE